MTPRNFDVVCVGNAKIDTFLTLHEANDHLRFAEDSNELCIKFGEKVTVDKTEILLGGNAANVAVGISRLGLNAGLIAEIGDDEFAQKIINSLSQEKVDTSNIKSVAGQQSSFSTIINFKGERTIFSEHVKRPHDFAFENITTKWVYLTSLGEEWKNAYEKTLDFVSKTNALLAFNPGTLQISAGLTSIKNVLQITEVLFVNKEEGEALLMINDKEVTINDLLNKLKELGPKIVVITDGENGSFAIDANGIVSKKEIIETQVIEKTGAGDAYSSGFLSGLINDKPISDCMDWGTKNSASVIGKVGAQAGLLHKNGLEEK